MRCPPENSGSHVTRRWRGVDSNFWFRARSEYGRGRRLAGLPGRYSAPAARPPALAIAARPLQDDHKHAIRREKRILTKLIVDAGTDRTANRLSSAMLRDDANPYRRPTALSVRSLSFPAARYHRRDLCVHTALSRPPSEAADRFQPDAGRGSLFFLARLQ